MNWLQEAKKRCEAALEPGILATCIQDTEDALRDLPRALELLEQAKHLLQVETVPCFSGSGELIDGWLEELEK